MLVEDLIKQLLTLPPKAECMMLWDGELRSDVDMAYLARSGEVVIAEQQSACYKTESRPENAPTYEQDKYWATPKVKPEKEF